MDKKKGRKKAFCVVMALAVLLSVGLFGMAASAAAPDLLGEWSITANSSRGHINITTQSGSEFSGTVHIDSGRTEKLINGQIDGDTVTFTRAWDSGTLRQDYTGILTVSGDGSATMSGTFSQNGSYSYSWSAAKTTPMSLASTPTPPPSESSGGLTPISGAVLNDQLSFKLDGKAVVPVGDDGTPVLPISYNGTTYLPVRAVGYLLGLGIDWDGPTNTVLIASTTTKAAPKAAAGTKSNTLIPISGAVLNGNLKFKLDGKAVIPVGDDGTPVLPISYNGTTYLPVRAMGYLLGLGIDWDGETRTVLITTVPSKASAPGWYFTHWEYIIMSQDYSLVGAVKGSVIAKTGNIWDYYVGTGEKNDFKYEHRRTYDDGSLVASGDSVTKWTDPPDYFSGTDQVVLNVDREMGSSWDSGTFSASFDAHDLSPGGATAGIIRFATPDGKTWVSESYQGTFQMEKALKGSSGQKKAIILYIGGYGFKYYYEWRE
ncbi:MAG: copper amine oxidase N-terminal domain-containing protein [Clostridiales bacterium]|nr:copper amine oxidase N-terminal domain-containing protein [Clostridiales bacterium]